MDVRLSAEQKALRDAAAQVVGNLAPKTVADLDDAERRAKLDAAVDATGWRELRAAADPTSGAAPLASGVEVGIVAEELGRTVANVASLGPPLPAALPRRAGAPPADGPETVAFRPDLSAIATATVNASSPSVTYGDAGSAPGSGASGNPTAAAASLARPALAFDAAGATSALLLVPTDGGGHALATVTLPGEVHDSAVVDLTRTSLPLAAGTPVDRVDGAAALSDEALTRWTALGLAAVSADLVGAMAGATELARAYAVERHQYGVAVGSFQAVQHLLADAFVATEGARSAALHAAWAVDALPADDALFAGAVAKAFATRAARTACESAIQVHGGIGNTWECLAHVHLRRALLTGDLLGGAGPNLDRVLAHHGIFFF